MLTIFILKSFTVFNLILFAKEAQFPEISKDYNLKFGSMLKVLRQFRGSKITKTFCHFSGKPSTTRQSVSEESREHKVDATEILPPFGRLNDTKGDFH